MKLQNLILVFLLSVWIPTFASVKLIQVSGLSPNSSLSQCPAFESAASLAEASLANPEFANEAKGILGLFEKTEGATAQLIFEFENEKYPIQYTRKNMGPISLPAMISLRIPGAQEGTIMNGTYSAQVRLTLAGSCPFYDKQKGALRSKVSVQEWEKYFELKRSEEN